MSTTGIGTLVSEALAEAEARNTDQAERAASLILDCVRADALVFTAGAGHSLAAVAETFYRAGGLACVYPVYHPDLLPLHGARASTVTERKAGLAAGVLDELAPGPRDVLVVFSTSGVNPYPVELAAAARVAGTPVIAVSSRASVAAAPRRSDGTLIDEADVVLDSGVRPGDASYPPENPRTAALSTVLNAFLWNLVLTRVIEKGDAEGVSVPLWRSSNVDGGDEANKALFAHYETRIPALR